MNRWLGLGHRPLQDFSAHRAIFHDQFANTYRQLESLRTRTAGVEIEHPISRFLLRNMAMAADHNGKTGSLRLEIQPREIVQHVNENAASIKHFGLWQFLCPCS